MNKKIACTVASLFVAMTSFAQTSSLKFNDNGKFKIVQFTDVHYKYNNPKSDISLERIKEVIDVEKPDLVVFTGDVIYAKPADKGFQTVMQPLVSAKIPFVVTFGNHDDEQGMSRKELMDVLYKIPYNLTDTVAGLSGESNVILKVASSKGNNNAAILYCIDSNSYSSVDGIGGYDFIKPDQIEWYRQNSKEFTKQNGGMPVPSLAFFHIPLPEFRSAATTEGCSMIGTRMEKSCPPELNSGFFTSIKQMKDVMGVFVGHDHDNDYAVNYHGVMLAYGRYTGGDTVYNNLANGARVIELTEGDSGFNTWIRLAGDQVTNMATFPQDFVRSNK